MENVQEYFREFERCRQYWKVVNKNISNFDENGFQIGVISGDKVYVLLDCEIYYNADPD
jgi:hypothetical protein